MWFLLENTWIPATLCIVNCGSVLIMQYLCPKCHTTEYYRVHRRHLDIFFEAVYLNAKHWCAEKFNVSRNRAGRKHCGREHDILDNASFIIKSLLMSVVNPRWQLLSILCAPTLENYHIPCQDLEKNSPLTLSADT